MKPNPNPLNPSLDAIESLARQLKLARADHGKFDKLHVKLLEEIIRCRRLVPSPRKRVNQVVPPTPTLADIQEVDTLVNHDFDPLSLIVRHKGWVRFMDDEQLGARRQFTHAFLQGTYFLLASDGIRGIVAPADAPQRKEVIVHMTNLTVVPLPPGPKKEKVEKEAKVKSKKVPVYNIDDLV